MQAVQPATAVRSGQPERVGQPCVLLKYGELALKGHNRGRFEHTLLANLTRTLADLPGITVRPRYGVVIVSGAATTEPADLAELVELVERTRRLPGFTLVHPALRAPRTVPALQDAARTLLAGHPGVRAGASFAVRARRRDKSFPLTSQQIGIDLGARACAEFGLRIDLRHPDVQLGVEVDHHEILLYTERLPGQGGLPVGVNGQALVLISGGFDSPVAGYRAMRRGLACDFVHFSGMPYTGPQSVYKAYALVRQLDVYRSGGARLWVVPFGTAQRSLATAGAGQLQVLAQRRLMVRTASRLARDIGAQALVTGDALGQVASQTLPNLVAVEDAAELPVLRPLLGFDKAEIVAEAERIGTAETSRLPDEDCCTLFASPLAETRASIPALRRLERRLDLDAVVDGLLAGAQLHEFVRSPSPSADRA